MIPKEAFEESLMQLLGPVRCYLEDPEVAEVMINGPDQVYVERNGRLELTDATFTNEESVFAALRNAAQYSGKHVDDFSPILEAHLPDGSRIQGILKPLATSGPYIAIRRFFQSRLSMASLIESGSLSPTAAETLQIMVEGKLNLVVSGGTGTGKTSLLNLLTSYIPEGERVGVLEDSKEVQVQRPHVFQMESRRKSDEEGFEAVTIRDLFRASLRMRPDRIIVGEIRGGEALDIIQAMVSGHGGCMCTLHASCPDDALMRLETMAMMSDIQLPLSALRRQVGSGIDAVVQLSRERGGRRVVTHISEVRDYDAKTDSYEIRDVFTRQKRGGASTLCATGIVPDFEEHLEMAGLSLPESLLREAQSARETNSH